MQEFQTKVWSVDNVDNSNGQISLTEAAKLLKQNEVVAFPTETVYGLGGNALSDEAIKKIYEAKGRPSDNPLIVHIANIHQLKNIVFEIPDQAKKLMDAFWPGPLTLILPKGNGVADSVTAGLNTVAVRMPSHPIAKALIEKAELPIAAPSANLSGKPSPTSAEHVYEDLNGRIPGIIDGGETGVGVESTVLDCSTSPLMILRPGGITQEQIQAIVQEEVLFDPALHKKEEAPKSPGMKYTHYAPNAPVYIVEGSAAFFNKTLVEHLGRKMKVGVLVSEELAAELKAEPIAFIYGSKTIPETIAHKLYHGLRYFNQYDLDVILAEAVTKEGVGQAVMNRLDKAAGGKYFREN